MVDPDQKELDFEIEFTGEECFIKLDDGRRIAKRENGKWVQLHRNWTVSGTDDEIVIEFNPDVNN